MATSMRDSAFDASREAIMLRHKREEQRREYREKETEMNKNIARDFMEWLQNGEYMKNESWEVAVKKATQRGEFSCTIPFDEHGTAWAEKRNYLDILGRPLPFGRIISIWREIYSAETIKDLCEDIGVSIGFRCFIFKWGRPRKVCSFCGTSSGDGKCRVILDGAEMICEKCLGVLWYVDDVYLCKKCNKLHPQGVDVSIADKIMCTARYYGDRVRLVDVDSYCDEDIATGEDTNAGDR